MRSFTLIPWLFLPCLLAPAPAFAHNLLLDCRVKGDRVRVEAFYDDDRPAQQAKIFLENESKQIVAEGRTDERGLWNCPAPSAGKYIVRAESVGHAARETLVVPETPKKEPAAPDKETKGPPEAKKESLASSFTDPDVADGPPRSRSSREEKTATPWLNLAIGFAVIALLCLGALVIRRRSARLNP